MTRELSLKAGVSLLKKAFAAKNVKLTHTEALDLMAQLKGYEAWSHLMKAQSKSVKPPHQLRVPTQPVRLTLAEVLKSHYGATDYPAAPRERWLYDLKEGKYRNNPEYWDWVELELERQDLLPSHTEFETPSAVKVTLPCGAESFWNIEQNLTDRWGSLNDHDARHKPGLTILELDEALCHPENLFGRLRAQMWEEDTFIVRKDNKFGVLYEVEYYSAESELPAGPKDSLTTQEATDTKWKPYAEVKGILLKGLQALQKTFPDVELAVPDKSQIVWERPAVWAFVPLDSRLTQTDRTQLGCALNSL